MKRVIDMRRVVTKAAVLAVLAVPALSGVAKVHPRPYPEAANEWRRSNPPVAPDRIAAIARPARPLGPTQPMPGASGVVGPSRQRAAGAVVELTIG